MIDPKVAIKNYPYRVNQIDVPHIERMTDSILNHPEYAGSFCRAVINRDWEAAAATADTCNAKHLHYYIWLMANAYWLEEETINAQG